MAQLHLFVSFVHLCHLFCLAVWVPVLLGKPAGLVAKDAYLAQSSVKDFLCSVVQWLPLGASLLELIFEVWLALFLP